jgi:hypothetical protein
MFNPLTPSEMVAAIGMAARTTARGDGELDEFDRGQLMSAYSATRHLAIEIESFQDELSARCAAIADAIDAAGEGEGEGEAHGDVGVGVGAMGALATRLRASPDARAAGDAIGELLDLCREHRLAALRGEIRTQLRALCDAEVTLLADGIEAGRA